MAEDRSLFYKDPDETRDFMRDWTLRLGEDTIATSVWTAIDDELVVVSESHTDFTATARVSGGPTIGVKYRLLNRITTTGGRTFDKTFKIQARAN